MAKVIGMIRSGRLRQKYIALLSGLESSCLKIFTILPLGLLL